MTFLDILYRNIIPYNLFYMKVKEAYYITIDGYEKNLIRSIQSNLV